MALPDGRTDRIDALLWLVLPVAVLFTIPIGFVSNDGLGHSLGFASGSWRLNPNHLLFQPLGAWWQSAGRGGGRGAGAGRRPQAPERPLRSAGRGPVPLGRGPAGGGDALGRQSRHGLAGFLVGLPEAVDLGRDPHDPDALRGGRGLARPD